MSIQRYGLFSDGDMWPVKEGFGKWVKHDDHKAALAEKEAELEKARELLKDALTTMEPDGHDTSYVHHDIAAYLGDKA